MFCLALLFGACRRPSNTRPSEAATLGDCLSRIDSSDGTGPCDCLAFVDARDGIDDVEAKAIAKAYFAGEGLAEFGHAGPVVRYGNQWRSLAVFGHNLVQRSPASITIDARTGAVSYPGRPAYATVNDLRSSATGVTCWGDPRLKAIARERDRR